MNQDIFFINGYYLDEYQKRIVLENDKDVLVVAGAGSGKSLTIIGKVRYLIEVLHLKQEEILIISFTNDAVNNLKNSIKTNYGYEIDIYTFHKLALYLLKLNNEEYSIASHDYLEFIIEEYFNGYIYENDEWIRRVLKYLKVKVRKNIEKTYSKYIESNDKEYLKLKKNILKFIKYFKNKNYDINDFYKMFKDNQKKLKYERENNIYFLRITLDIYILYQNELKSSCKIDFDDMINKCVSVIHNLELKYKYIIIDEYQDTSYSRYLIVNEIKKVTNAKVLAVGDDFQSIYRFTGCDLSMFLNFNNYFNNSIILPIVNTYRNNQELINVAGKFIMKNSIQIKKNLISSKRNKKPINILYSKRKFLYELIKYIYINYGNEIMILGRNNNDIYKYIDKRFILDNDKIIIDNDNNIKIRFLTVHKSKGLESENVIILNMVNDNNGFPSYIEDDKVLKLLDKKKDFYYLEEERRLFYVALTRTKNNVFIMSDRDKKSIFVKEILKYRNEVHIINCDKYGKNPFKKEEKKNK